MRVAATVATFGHLVWLAGNVREHGAGAIERWADDPPSSLFAVGSPARYYPPIVAVTLGAALRVLLVSRSRRFHKRFAVTSVGASTTALATTVLLIRTVNLPLYRGDVAAPLRRRLVQRWYLLNRLRIATLVCATLASLRCATAAPGVAALLPRRLRPE